VKRSKLGKLRLNTQTIRVLDEISLAQTPIQGASGYCHTKPGSSAINCKC
jgi:hypothetical protein